MNGIGSDGAIRLHDGRRLAYREYGERNGRPVFFFHGLPGSRFGSSPLDGSARASGVRLIAPDRPGMGLSDPQPGRTLLDWPRDVAELAEALGIASYSVIGVSAGMPYVLACAVAPSPSLSRAAILSGMGRIDAPGALDGMYGEARAVYGMAQRSARFGSLWVGMFANVLRHAPEVVVRQQHLGFSEADRAVFARPEMRAARLADLNEGLRQGPAAARREVHLHTRDWGFRLEDVAAEIYLWQGMHDRSHPPAMAEYYARTIPRCRLVLDPAAGSLGYIDQMAAIFTDIFGDALPDKGDAADPEPVVASAD